jgi:hypothetical protein
MVRQTLEAAQTANTAYGALYAALETVERKLHDYRCWTKPRPRYDASIDRYRRRAAGSEDIGRICGIRRRPQIFNRRL